MCRLTICVSSGSKDLFLFIFLVMIYFELQQRYIEETKLPLLLVFWPYCSFNNTDLWKHLFWFMGVISDFVDMKWVQSSKTSLFITFSEGPLRTWIFLLSLMVDHAIREGTSFFKDP